MANRNNLLKLLAGVIVVAAAFGFLYAQYATTTAAIVQPAPRPVAAVPGQPAAAAPPVSPMDREQARQELYALIKPTDEQKEQLAAYEKKYGLWIDHPQQTDAEKAERKAAIEKILSLPQRIQLRDFIREKVKARLAQDMKRLPPDEQAKFKDKLGDKFPAVARLAEGTPKP